MARITVEDCVKKIPNRFELVLCAAQRVKEILSGSPLTVPEDNDKRPVTALREIAAGTINKSDLTESLVKDHQNYIELDDSEEDVLQSLAAEQDWISKATGAIMDQEIEDDGLTIQDLENAD